MERKTRKCTKVTVLNQDGSIENVLYYPKTVHTKALRWARKFFYPEDCYILMAESTEVYLGVYPRREVTA